MSKLEDTLPSLVETVISAAESLEDERLETACEAFIAPLAATARLAGAPGSRQGPERTPEVATLRRDAKTG